MKKAEEYLKKHEGINVYSHLDRNGLAKLMESYHQERIKEELIEFTEWAEQDEQSELNSYGLVIEYLNTKEQ